MKLYIENGEVLFDYSDIDTKAELNAKTTEYRRYVRATGCWEETSTPQVARMVCEPYSWATEYGNAKNYERILSSCYYKAKLIDCIEVSKDIEELLVETARKCREFYEAEVAKEERLKAAAKWDSLCTYGCGNCSHKKRCGDDYLCDSTGAILEEKNIPQPNGRVYQLFNYQAMPDDNCPFNVNKNKEN